MSSTILMVIVLVVMWLVVLVPMFVRRHEPDHAATAQVRVLARRAPRSHGSRSHHGHPHLRQPADARGWPASAASAFSRDQARRRALRRRRRTLLLLLALVGLGAAGAMLMTAWFWILQGVGTVLLVGYVRWLRQQVRRERARGLRRAALFARTAPALFPTPLGHHRTRHPGAAPHRAHPQTTARPSGWHPAHPADPRAPAADDDTWKPVPVPVPTYITKPAARRVDPVVGLDDEDPALLDIDPIVEPAERRRAANG